MAIRDPSDGHKPSMFWNLRHIWKEDGEKCIWGEQNPPPYVLFRYVSEQFAGDVEDWKFWTEAKTDHPDLASDYTGVPANECVWRISIELTKDELDEWFTVGHHIKNVYEYSNLRPIPEDRIVWRKLQRKEIAPPHIRNPILENRKRLRT